MALTNTNFTNNKAVPKKKVAAKRNTTAPKKKEDTSNNKTFELVDLEYLTSPSLFEVLTNDISTTYIITGKGFGKNRAVGLKIIYDMEHDVHAHGLALKKYKTNAAQRLHETISNLAIELKMRNYWVKPYTKGQSFTYRERARDNKKNQMIEYTSAEKLDEIAGIEAKNLGYFSVAWFDEPVISEDTPDKIPTGEEWDKFISVFMDSVMRSSTRRTNVTGDEVPDTRFFYTMNPWDKHPIILYADKMFPEAEFLEFVKEDIIENHAKLWKDERTGVQILRGTKFGNPIIYHTEKLLRYFGVKTIDDWTEELENQVPWEDEIFKKYTITKKSVMRHLNANKGVPLYIQAERAIEEKNKTELARLLGLSFEGTKKFRNTYDLTNLQTADTEKVLKGATDTTKLYMSWDIDTRKGGKYVLTPVWLQMGNNLIHPGSIDTQDGGGIKKVKNIIVGRQITIHSDGLGDDGRRIKHYQDRLAKATIAQFEDYRSKGGNGAMPICAIDDNSKHFIAALNEQLRRDVLFRPTKFKNANNWQILKRQVWLQTAIDSGLLIIDEKNTGLIEDLKKSIVKEGAEQRDESAGKAKDYDRINSMEYALYYLRRELSADLLFGRPENYTKEVIQDEFN